MRRICALIGLLTMFAVAQAATPPKVTSPRLYILDCGYITPMDPALFSLKKEEIKSDASFVSPCYLVVHPRGTLIWDVGQVPDAKIKDDGSEAEEQDILKARHRLSTQLAALGYQIKDIDFLAMSHYHADHTANANAFVGSTWIVQQAEYDMMFSDAQVGIRTPDSYKDLKNAKRITLKNEDHDVFGDGTMIVKRWVAHTPGSQMMTVKLKNTGLVILTGDNVYFRENVEKNLPPNIVLAYLPTGFFTAYEWIRQTMAAQKADFFTAHDPDAWKAMKKAPAYYD
jgi:glyoxylase-like metal-dependent hydrolase (beta-lactamase superfamily II)